MAGDLFALAYDSRRCGARFDSYWISHSQRDHRRESVPGTATCSLPREETMIRFSMLSLLGCINLTLSVRCLLHFNTTSDVKLSVAPSQQVNATAAGQSAGSGTPVGDCKPSEVEPEA